MRKQSLLFLTVMSILLAASVPNTALGTVRYVARTTTDCGTLSPCYTSIQTAINNSVSNDSIEIQANDSPYVEKFSLPTNLTADFSLSIYGTETARTVISGGGSGTVITADNPTTATGTLTVTIRNVTIISATTGIQASNKVSVNIKNTIIRSISSTGVNVVSPISANIFNNTFYNNGTAISRDTTIPIITNNIFSNNTTAAISPFLTTNLSTNNYFNNRDDGTVTREASAVSGDPLFVNIANGDFHLKAGSPCIDAGDTTVGDDDVDASSADIGAYGGPLMDTVPFPVSGLIVNDNDTTDTSIPVSWSPNECYLTTGYKIYYRKASGTYGAPDTSTAPNHIIIGLTPDPQPTPSGDPNLQTTVDGSTALTLTWTDVTDETAYEIRYNLATCTPAQPPNPPNPEAPPCPADTAIDNIKEFTLPIRGLQDYIDYTFNVTPYAQQTYYIAVTAVYNTSVGEFESNLSDEVTGNAGPKQYGTTSEKTDFSEPITPYPNLKNTGCFIATAAYGHYSAPQVQALRDFRDEYFLTNAPGRAFVRWYYTYGPIGAKIVNEHPWLKPVVRAALLPAVGGAMFMTRTTGIEKAIVLSILMIVCGYALYYKKKLVRAGGRQ